MPIVPQRLAKLADTFRAMRNQAREYGVAPMQVYKRAFALRRSRGFGFYQSLNEGLLDPALPPHVLDSCIPKNALLDLQRRMNPQARECLTEDKALFGLVCESLGLPVPALYAVFGSLGGHSRSGQALVGRDAWVAHIEQALPDEFVVKPAYGYYGMGVRVLQKTGGALQQHDGRRLSAAELVDELHAPGTFRKFIFQQRVRPHPVVAEMSGSGALQTARVVTLVRDGGDVLVNHAALRISRRGQVVDNLHAGRTGNLAARIDLATGRLAEGWIYNERMAMVRTDTHPDSGRPLRGCQLPHWDEAMSLVRRAAVLFLPSRCLGWDIGFTTDGPVIVETNMHWDPTNLIAIDVSAGPEQRSIRDLFRDMRELTAHGPVGARD